VYQELLTGTLPFNGKNVRQLLFQHTREEPKLDPLPEHDRPIVARALNKDPDKRFKSCMEFVLALQRESSPQETAASAGPATPLPSKTPANGAKKRAEPLPAETVSNTGAEGDTWIERKSPPTPAEVVPGFRFIKCLGKSPLMDQWKVQAPDGAKRLLKLIY